MGVVLDAVTAVPPVSLLPIPVPWSLVGVPNVLSELVGPYDLHFLV